MPCCANCNHWEVDFKLFERYEYNFCGVCRRMTQAGHVCPDWEGYDGQES